MWTQFHSRWLDDHKVPTYVLRYEDLLSAPQKTLTGLSRFLLNREDLTGCNILTRNQNIVKQDVYKPRCGKIGVNKKYFSKA